ncbi:MAG: OmpH family outer membrane protein [Muribaculaceae bacterium]|nr:OmpH family outer membrane protein [Muribaculaceae bacterium]
MKKLFTALCIAILSIGFCTTACSNADSKDDKAQSSTKAKPKPSKNAQTGNLPNYRYVDSDTLLAKYNLAKDYQEEMLRQQNAYENTARQRQSAIESLMKKYDQQMKNGQMNEASYNAAMQDLQSRQAAAEKELSQLQVNMQNQMLEAQKIVNDSIMNFVQEYNESFGYDAILMKAATLYIDPALDITDEILEGLNARYNKQ